jgi:hypothetical protein
VEVETGVVAVLSRDDEPEPDTEAEVEEEEREWDEVEEEVGMPVMVPMVLVDEMMLSGALATLEGTGSVRVREETGEEKEPVMPVSLASAG